ncbi:MAG: M1 family metallopeptidase [Gemmatimonadaceae bacterium]
MSLMPTITRALAVVATVAALPFSHATAQTTATKPKVPPRVAALATLVPADVAPDSTHPYRPGIDVRHYAFAIRLPKNGENIEGRATITAMRRATIDTLVLDLVGMTVDSVQVGKTTRVVVRDSATIRVPLTAADGSLFSVTVAYHGAPSDGLIIHETAERGWSAFGDNWPQRARFWLPAVDHPSDKATVAWTITAPTELAIVANGLQSARVALPDGNTRTNYEIHEAIPTYLMVLAAAKIVATPLGQTCGVGEEGACISQTVWTFPAEKQSMPGAFAETGKIVSFYSKIVGPFAYEQLNHLQSATRFGGMENATAIFYSDNAFKNHSVGQQLIAHETAHQWFGDAVTPRRWQDLWLSEGFASYLAPLFLRSVSGDSAFKKRMSEIREEIIAAPIVSQRPVVDTVGAATPTTLLNANSYQKGAFVLHMLRGDIGDSAFFQGLRDYQRTYRNGTATTDNLRLALEKSSGESLAVFFDQWLHRPGFAQIDVTWAWDAAKRIVTFTVHQGDKFPPFGVPVVVSFRDASGKEERHTIHLETTSDQTIVQPLGTISAPTTIVLDPDVELLARLTLSPSK